MDNVHNIVQEVVTKTIPKKKKWKKAKWLSQEALENSREKKWKRREKGKDLLSLNTEFHRIAREDKKGFLNEQCKEIEENYRKRKTRDLFKKIGRYQGNISCKNGHDIYTMEYYSAIKKNSFESVLINSF